MFTPKNQRHALESHSVEFREGAIRILPVTGNPFKYVPRRRMGQRSQVYWNFSRAR